MDKLTYRRTNRLTKVGENLSCYMQLTISGQGWGYTSWGGFSSDVLLEVEVPVVSQDECKATMGSSYSTAGMICAGGVEGQDGCQVSELLQVYHE